MPIGPGNPILVVGTLGTPGLETPVGTLDLDRSLGHLWVVEVGHVARIVSVVMRDLVTMGHN